MTKPHTIRDALLALSAAYPRQELSKETVKLYAAMLSDLDPVQLMSAVRDLIQRSKWFPTVAEIRNTVDELYHPRVSGIEAWGTLRTFRARDVGERVEELAVDTNGIRAIVILERTVCPESECAEFRTDQMASARARFVEAWDAQQRAERRDQRRALLGVETLPQIAASHTEDEG